jgi:hypothetical protein
VVQRLAEPVMSICSANSSVELQQALQLGVERFGFQSYNLSF